jgi:hypothetical protein
MNNESLIEFFEKWHNGNIDQNELASLLSGVINPLIQKDNDRVNSIIEDMPKHLLERYLNMLGICSSHQHCMNKEGDFVAGQFQILIPIIFYPDSFDDRLKIQTELSPMIINKYATEILIASGYGDAEFHAYPYLIPGNELKINFTEIFHLSEDLWDREIAEENVRIYTKEPIVYYLYGRIYVPDEFNIFTNNVETKFQDPSKFFKQSQELKKMIEAYLRIKKSDMKVFVGNPNTIPHVLGNIEAFEFISEILMKFSLNDYAITKNNMVAEINSSDNEVSILFYHNNKCVFIYAMEERYFPDMNTEDINYDLDYFQSILQTLGMKKVIISYRKINGDENSIIGRDILSLE